MEQGHAKWGVTLLVYALFRMTVSRPCVLALWLVRQKFAVKIFLWL